MAFGFFQGNFFPVSPDEILVGSFGGKGAGREILFPEETLLQLSGMVREKKIVEPAAVILKSFAGQGFDSGHELIHGTVLEIGFFKLLEPVHEVFVFLFCISRFCQKEKGIEIGLFRGDTLPFQIGGKKGGRDGVLPAFGKGAGGEQDFAGIQEA